MYNAFLNAFDECGEKSNGTNILLILEVFNLGKGCFFLIIVFLIV
jgi:hypothetical protein